jgi:hypothetical protein
MSANHNDPYATDFLVDDGDPDARSTLYVGVVGVVLLVVTVVGLTAIFNHVVAEERYKKETLVRPAARLLYEADQAGKLTDYGWVDQTTGVVQLPIDRAMELVVRERQSSE